MILVNFGHPLTSGQRLQIEAACRQPLLQVVHVPFHCDHGRSFSEQAVEIVDSVGLTAGEWQSSGILVIPPSLSAIACACIAELHGRMGYFPMLVRLGPRRDRMPPVFEVAELVDLQQVREASRRRR